MFLYKASFCSVALYKLVVIYNFCTPGNSGYSEGFLLNIHKSTIRNLDSRVY